MFLCKHLRRPVTSQHNSEVLKKARRPREKFFAVVDEHHGTIDDSGSNNRENHVGCKLQPWNVIIGKRNNQDILGVACHGESRTNVSSGCKGEKVWKRVGHLVLHTEINHNTREDKHNRVIHHSCRPNGGHRHDLKGALPVDRVIKGVPQFVKETTPLHLLKVNGGEHETKQEKEGFHDNDPFRIEPWAMASDLKKEPPHNHRKTSTECNTRASNREEPVREHEEHPKGEVDDSGGPLSEGREFIRNVHMCVLPKVTVTAAGVLHHTTLIITQVARTETPLAREELVVREGIKVQCHDIAGPRLRQLPCLQVPIRQRGDAVACGSKECGIDSDDTSDGHHCGTPCPEGGGLLFDRLRLGLKCRAWVLLHVVKRG
mmetsp:Transcript_25126/g.51212  ORF Transcript_25126/g.51212 Transcript_25126/m.51212 type:complete len:374 (-) Transcript_25126:97-1218(-)